MNTIALTPYSDTGEDPIEIQNASLSFPHGSRRLNRVQLIGDGNYFHDGGFYPTDREAVIVGGVSRIDARTLGDWIASGLEVYFVDNEGIYKAIIKSADLSDGNVNITLWILEQEFKTSDMLYPPPVSPYTDATDDTYWLPGTGTSWDGSKWSNIITKKFTLYEKNNFLSGYRGASMRVTYTMPVGATSIRVLYAPLSYIANVAVYTSLDVVPLDFSAGQDIGYFSMSDQNDAGIVIMNVTKIEFYGL